MCVCALFTSWVSTRFSFNPQHVVLLVAARIRRRCDTPNNQTTHLRNIQLLKGERSKTRDGSPDFLPLCNLRLVVAGTKFRTGKNLRWKSLATASSPCRTLRALRRCTIDITHLGMLKCTLSCVHYGEDAFLGSQVRDVLRLTTHCVWTKSGVLLGGRRVSAQVGGGFF